MGIHAQISLANTWTALQTFASSQFAAPNASAVGDVQGAGSAVTLSRSDHVHAREAFGAVASETSFGIAAANGVATTIARSDHTHGTPTTPVTSIVAGTNISISGSTGAVTVNSTYAPSFVAPAFTLGTANATGAASTFIRSDASIALFDATTPANLATSAAVGSVAFAARRDHVHSTSGLAVLAASSNTFTGPVFTDSSSISTRSEMFSVRAGYGVTGGGTVTWSGSALSWTTRLIVIAQGNGSVFAASGYFDISVPADGTVITGVGGASNVTVASGAIPIGSWTALWYILPIGSSNGTVAANFRVSTYTGAQIYPAEWLLIAVRNDDVSSLRFCTGATLKSGYSLSSGESVSFGSVSSETSFGISASNGSSGQASRSDHTHGTPANPIAYAAVTSATSFSISAADGTATTVARSDHTHGTPTTPVTSAVAGTGIGVSGATGAVTISNTGVTSIVAGTNVTISGSTGAVTINASSSGGATYATPALTLSTTNSAGAASTGIRSDATIALFDATTPADLGTAATGSVAFAARRDHVHGTTNLALLNVANIFSSSTGQQVTKLGLGIAPDALNVITLSATLVPDSTSQNSGFSSNVTFSPSVSNTSTQRAMKNLFTAGSNLASGSVVGFDQTGTINSAINTVFGIQVINNISHTTGTISSVRAGSFYISGTSGAGSINNSYGIEIANGGGTVTGNRYGLYISDLNSGGAGSATNLSFYIANSNAWSKIDGRLEVGTFLIAGTQMTALNTTAPGSITFGTSATSAGAGSSTTPARVDHVHGFPALFDTTNPAALGTAGAGSASVAARRDHIHSNSMTMLGINQTPNGSDPVYMTHTTTSITVSNLIRAELTASPATDPSVNDYAAIQSLAQTGSPGSSMTASRLYGVYARAESGVSLTSGHLYGVYSQVVNTGTATVANAYGARLLYPYNSSTGTITNSYGLHISKLLGNSGTVTTSYGIYLANPTGGTISTKYGAYIDDYGTGSSSNYSLYVVGTLAWSKFEGRLDVGSLFVNGTQITSGATYATPALTLSTTNSAGSATTGIRSDATIALFDATAPTSITFGTSATSAAVGSIAFAARRDHIHGFPALFDSTVPAALGTAAAGSAAVAARRDHVHPLAGPYRYSHSFLISDTVNVASGDVDFIPPIFVPVKSGNTVQLVAVRYKINSGTSVTFKLQRNGVDVTGATSMSCTTTATTTDFSDVTCADGDVVAMVVTAVSGTPKNMSVSLYWEIS